MSADLPFRYPIIHPSVLHLILPLYLAGSSGPGAWSYLQCPGDMRAALLGGAFSIICVISIAISLAAAIGPSSAILLTPRLAYWPAGSTDIWLNVTFQDQWPDR